MFGEYERLFNCSGLRLNADKTEILRLSSNQGSNIEVQYLDKNISLEPAETIKICGNHLHLDQNIRYDLNITSKIKSLEKILENWSRRCLSINGKMMIIKCHALSQLTFANQFQNILGKDIKRIEKICYKYLWNGGPERVKRSTLKLAKLDGGIDGIDVESFLLAIKIRQFIKADLNCEPLRYVQNLFPNDEDISRSSRVCLSRLLRHYWKSCDILD